MNDNKDKIVKKIQSLLKLADTTKNNSEAEAKAALLKAQELMIKHSIDMGLLNKEEADKQKNVTEKIIISKGKILWYEKSLANVIGENFRIQPFYRMNSVAKINNMVFLGLEEEVEIAEYVYNFIMSAMKRCYDLYCTKNNLMKNTKYRNDYYTGFIRGINEALKEQVEENNWGLVLVKDALVVEAVNKLNLINVKPKGIKPKWNNNLSTINEGYKNGLETGKDIKNNNNKLSTN